MMVTFAEVGRLWRKWICKEISDYIQFNSPFLILISRSVRQLEIPVWILWVCPGLQMHVEVMRNRFSLIPSNQMASKRKKMRRGHRTKIIGH